MFIKVWLVIDDAFVDFIVILVEMRRKPYD